MSSRGSSTARTALVGQRTRLRERGIASRVVLVIGVLTALSSLRPRLWRSWGFLRDVLPGLVPGTARSSLLVVSITLLLLSRGLRRGSRLALLGSVTALAASAVLHLAAGGRSVVAVVIAVVGGLWLVARRSAFTVLPQRRAVRRAALLAVVGVLAILVLAGLFTMMALHNPHPVADLRIRRVAHLVELILTVGFLLSLGWSLVAPRRPVRLGARDQRVERERARAVVARYGGGTLDYFALRDDKSWFFVGQSMVAHSVRAGVCLVSPDPIGPVDEREQTWAEFLNYAHDFGWSVAVIGATAPWLPVYEASGLRTVYLGDEAIVDCTRFSLAGGERKSLRQAVNRVAKGGWTTTFVDPLELDEGCRAQVLAMSAESRHGEGERGFSMTLSRMFDPDDTGLLLALTRAPDGRVDAFCQFTPAASIDGWSLDVMRRRMDVEDLPNGLIDFTIARTIDEVVRRGQHSLGLNFAVMREVLENEPATRFDALVRPLLQRVSATTQMSSLATFNSKYGPGWVPRYVVLDAAEFVATQALVMAEAEGVTEIPLIGRFMARAPRPGS
ncbi:MAG: phosphatidylglycerol lysyltransferase domain-containing protein [Cellulomonas sp.]|nr:phosphatidylglycerol lysyltransferase domain-containing protein [Cellulomonas sp.]